MHGVNLVGSDMKQVLANAVVTCRHGPTPEPASLFVDKRNSEDFDLAR